MDGVLHFRKHNKEVGSTYCLKYSLRGSSCVVHTMHITCCSFLGGTCSAANCLMMNASYYYHYYYYYDDDDHHHHDGTT